MLEERSAGAIVFHTNRRREYLLLKYPAGHWDFPKGNVEEGETDLQTALREVKEETSLEEVRPMVGFRKEIEYFYKRDGQTVRKRVVFLLAEDMGGKVKLSYEHQDFGLFEYQEALRRVTYQNSKNVLRAAETYLLRGQSTLDRKS